MARPPIDPGDYAAEMMNEVIPNLWLGSLRAAQDTESLRRNNIHSILSIMRGKVKISEVYLKFHQLRFRSWVSLFSLLSQSRLSFDSILISTIRVKKTFSSISSRALPLYRQSLIEVEVSWFTVSLV